MLPFLHVFTSRPRLALAGALPALAATVAIALPCDCSDHPGHGATASVAPTPAGHAAHASHAAVDVSPATASTAGDHDVQPARASAHHERAMTFEVGSPQRPFIAKGARGPLWSTTKPAVPGRSSHGSFAELTVAQQLQARRDAASTGPAADELVAERAAVLTTAAATKRLSKRCQKLIKAKKGKLTKADRKRRSACLTQRRALVDASKTPRVVPSAPGPAAPAAPIDGPKPTAAPAAPPTNDSGAAEQPKPTTPAATTPVQREPVYGAVGVQTTDTDPSKFRLTRGFADADIVNFELDNIDSQIHNLFIAPGNAAGDVTGAPVEVVGNLEGGRRESKDVRLAPGIYVLICTIPGHSAMKVKFTVNAPPAA